jgi:hypothetical protein
MPQEPYEALRSAFFWYVTNLHCVTPQKNESHLHHGRSLKSRTVRSQVRIHVSICNTSNLRGHDVIRSRRMVSVEVSFRFWVTRIVASQIHRALKLHYAYRKQLCTTFMPTDHIFPRCNENSVLCRRLHIADPPGVCVMLTCYRNWGFRVKILLVCLCSESHYKRIYTIGHLAEVIIFTPYTHLSFRHQVLFIISGSAAHRVLWSPRHTRFLDHTQRRPTIGRTPLDE